MNEVYIRAVDLPRWMVDKYFRNNDLISIADLIDTIEDLDDEYDMLKEEYEEFKQNVESNYKQMTMAEQVGWNENW